jgi:translation initiation factor 2B subunit (eIF-2B alpha/beta/delta family)
MPSLRSSVVEKTLLSAHEEGRQFSVFVVDSRPMLEGVYIHSSSIIVIIVETHTPHQHSI